MSFYFLMKFTLYLCPQLFISIHFTPNLHTVMENTNSGKTESQPKSKFHRNGNPETPGGMKSMRPTGKNSEGTAYLRGHKSKIENSGN